MNLALFDLDHTLLPLDSDYEWGQFLVRIGAVEAEAFAQRNAEFFHRYQAGSLDPVEYLEFVFGVLATFPRAQLDAWHGQFMEETILPAVRPNALDLVKRHLDAGDLVAIVTATNRFVTEPIARVFGVGHLVASEGATTADGNFTGRHVGEPNYGAGKIVNTQAWLAARGSAFGDFARSWFYSDSQNDIPMLSIVTDPVATNPNATLSAHAQAHGWPIIRLFDD